MFTVIQIDRPDIVTTEMKKLSLSSQEPFTLFICLLINCISLFLVARFTKQIFEWIELSESPFIPQISNQINKISAALFVYIIVRLDRVMADRKINLKDLSEQVGIANVNLSKIKTGKVSAIRFSTLNAICKALDCQPGDILEYQEDED